MVSKLYKQETEHKHHSNEQNEFNMKIPKNLLLEQTELVNIPNFRE